MKLARTLSLIGIVGSAAATLNGTAAQEKKDAPPVAPTITVGGSVQIMAQKWLYEDKKANNIDAMWGRANMSVSAKSEKFDALLFIRSYPEGFGYEPIVGIEKVSQTDTSVSVTTTNTKIAKFQILFAWFEAKNKVVNTKVGRMLYQEGNTRFYGNYIDDSWNDGKYSPFISRGSVQNALQFSKKVGKLSSSVSLISKDANVNTGDLRIYETLKLNDNLVLGAGYKANVFDKINNDKAVIKHRADFQTSYNPFDVVDIYGDLGILNFGKDLTSTVPVMVGVSILPQKVLDNVRLEVEFLDREKMGDGNLGNAFWAFQMEKKFTKNVSILGAVYSAKASGDVGVGTLLTGKF